MFEVDRKPTSKEFLASLGRFGTRKFVRSHHTSAHGGTNSNRIERARCLYAGDSPQGNLSSKVCETKLESDATLHPLLETTSLPHSAVLIQSIDVHQSTGSLQPLAGQVGPAV